MLVRQCTMTVFFRTTPESYILLSLHVCRYRFWWVNHDEWLRTSPCVEHHQSHLPGGLFCKELHLSSSMRQLGCEATELSCCDGGDYASSDCNFETAPDSDVFGCICNQKEGSVSFFQFVCDI